MEMNIPMIRARIGEAADSTERRRMSRFPVELQARVRELGANGVEARVLNISKQGFMAETDGDFGVGTRIWLMLPGQNRANATVKWVAGDRIGAEFTTPQVLEELRTAQDV